MFEAIKNLFKKKSTGLEFYGRTLCSPVARPPKLPASNHYESDSYQILKYEYEYLWPVANVQSPWLSQADRAVHTALVNKSAYLEVEKATKIPWFFIAALHMRESNFDFKKHLHNGDPLTARTLNVPKNRPETGAPPFTFAESAIDALQYEGFAMEDNWDVATVFYNLEAWNGHGYRRSDNECTPTNACPYVYSGTQFYDCGKFISDHRFERSLADAQLGTMAFLKHLSLVDKVF